MTPAVTLLQLADRLLALSVRLQRFDSEFQLAEPMAPEATDIARGVIQTASYFGGAPVLLPREPTP